MTAEQLVNYLHVQILAVCRWQGQTLFLYRTQYLRRSAAYKLNTRLIDADPPCVVVVAAPPRCLRAHHQQAMTATGEEATTGAEGMVSVAGTCGSQQGGFLV